MGKLQNKLAELLSTIGHVGDYELSRPTREALERSGLSEEITRIFRDLGGISNQIPTNPGRWDLEFEGIAVELDEHLHFNRYRLITLASVAYTQLPRFPVAPYRGFCERREIDCQRAGKHGRRWSNQRCEKQFGPAGQAGDLSNFGSPRWKQRAFYDFLKDLSPLTTGVHVARIAIWDVIQEAGSTRTIKDALTNPYSETASALASLLIHRGG